MPGFRENLVGIGPMCDAGYTVSFTDEAVVISKDDGVPILHGWREQDGPKLWRISLLPDHDSVETVITGPTTQRESLVAYSAYDLPSVEALVRYFHAAAGFPVKDTWLSAIKAGHFDSWPGLTYKNAAKYCPMSDETLKGHMVQTRQNVRSTRPTQGPLKFQRSTTVPTIDSAAFSPEPREVGKQPNQLYLKTHHISKLYTDDTGRFPFRARSGNQYVMVAYHPDSNAILAVPFKTRADRHRLLAYAEIMQRLKDRNMAVDLQILDNEASAEYKQLI